MAIQYYMDYQIFFQDAGEYQMAVSIAGGNLIKLSPRDAATLFGIPYPYPTGDLSTIPRGITFFYPYTPGAEFKFPGATGIFVDDAILTKTVPGQAGNPASVWPTGPDGVFTWSGNITRSGSAKVTSSPTAISQRRWIAGAELAVTESGSVQGNTVCRDYSRTIDGQGWGIRGNNFASPATKNITDLRPGYAPRTSWERFYVRVRRLPVTNNIIFWYCHGTNGVGDGAILKLHTDGTIHSYNKSGVEVDKGAVFTPVLNVWYRIDTFLGYSASVITHTGNIVHYVNGVLSLAWTDGTGTGISTTGTHSASDLGRNDGTADNEIEMDFDDWICADMPLNTNSSLNFIDANYPIDWVVGSHVRLHYSISASQANWTPTGGALVLNQGNIPSVRPMGSAQLSSTTALATIEGLTDVVLKSIADSIATVVGAINAVLSMWSSNSAGTDGQLGYRKAAAAAVMTTIDQTGVEAKQLISFFAVGQILPTEYSPWSVVHIKSNDANTDITYMMLSIIEYIGIWGPEDDPLFQYPISRMSNLHNCRYGNTTWGYLGSEPAAPQYTIGFTYVGNGSYQEFVLPAACHFLYIRPVTDATPGIWFQGASVGAHFGTGDTINPAIRMWFDLTNGAFKFSVAGTDTSGVNINGKTYQVIAFCDPGMRFTVASAFSHGNNSTPTPRVNNLINPNFTPELVFFQFEFISVGGVNQGLTFKGPNETGNNGRNVNNSTTIANIANLGLGVINSFNNLHLNSTGPLNYLAWRRQDSGPGGCSGVAFQITTYIGNGAGGNRTIPLTPASSRFPLLTIIWASTGTDAAYRRDPSHTGVNSSDLSNNGNVVSAITGVGLDSVTVGSTLNSNGITYTIFTLCGDSAGNNNGTFFATYCGVGDPPWIPPNSPDTDPNMIGNGGLILGGIASNTLIKDASGIYTLKPGQAHDALIDRNTAPSGELDVKIPDPTWKTGYLGG